MCHVYGLTLVHYLLFATEFHGRCMGCISFRYYSNPFKSVHVSIDCQVPRPSWMFLALLQYLRLSLSRGKKDLLEEQAKNRRLAEARCDGLVARM